MTPLANLPWLLILLQVFLVVAVPSPDTTLACTDINNALPGKVLTPVLLPTEYNWETQQYWATNLRTDKPACIVQPDSAEDVSAVVKVLSRYPNVKFTTRSGGHDPNNGHSSIQDGVLIVMTDMAGATYDSNAKVAYVKPGGEWNDVIGQLEPSGVTIAGGRLGLVGVAGLLLGGGLSFLSTQEGLAADNIVGWETVMANGSIINVDATTQPDLARAMRGSVGQFGIVTKFTVNVHPISTVWGGFCTYNALQDQALYKALHAFTGNGAQDPKAAIIFTDLVLAANTSTKLIYYFYDGPKRPTSGPFADFFKIPSLVCAPKAQKYSELLRSNGEIVRLLNARAFFRTYTIPYIASRPQMYAEIKSKLTELSAPILNVPLLVRATQLSVDFQPLPAVIGAHSAAKGGNAMGLTASDPDRIILIFQGAWNLPSDDAKAYDIARKMTMWLDEVVPQWLAEAGVPSNRYMPLFVNDAMFDQDVYESYRDYEKFKALQRSVDPDGLWSRRSGGFKY